MTPGAAARRAAARIEEEGEEMEGHGSPQAREMAAAASSPGDAVAWAARIGAETVSRAAREALSEAETLEDEAATAFVNTLAPRVQEQYQARDGSPRSDSARKRGLYKYATTKPQAKKRQKEAQAFADSFQHRKTVAMDADAARETAELARGAAEQLQADLDKEVEEDEEVEEEEDGEAKEKGGEDGDEGEESGGEDDDDPDSGDDHDRVEKKSARKGSEKKKKVSFSPELTDDDTPGTDKKTPNGGKRKSRMEMLKEATEQIDLEEKKGGRGAKKARGEKAAVEEALRVRREEARSAKRKKDEAQERERTKREKAADKADKAKAKREKKERANRAKKGAEKAKSKAAKVEDFTRKSRRALRSASTASASDGEDSDSAGSEEEEEDTDSGSGSSGDEEDGEPAGAATPSPKSERQRRRTRRAKGGAKRDKREGVRRTPKVTRVPGGMATAEQEKHDVYVQTYRSLVAASPAAVNDRKRTLLQEAVVFFAEISPAKSVPAGSTMNDVVAAAVLDGGDAAAGPGRLPRALKTYDTAKDALRARLGWLAVDAGDAVGTRREHQAERRHAAACRYISELRDTVMKTSEDFADFQWDLTQELEVLAERRHVSGFAQLRRGSGDMRRMQGEVKSARNDLTGEMNKIRKQLAAQEKEASDQRREAERLARRLKDAEQGVAKALA